MLNNAYTNIIFRGLKKFIIRCFYKNVHLSPQVMIDWQTEIHNGGNRLTLGRGVYLRSIRSKYQAAMGFPTTILIDVAGASVDIGANSRINGAYIHAQNKISIGENCVIASGVNIMDSNGHEVYSLNRVHGRDKPGEILIGNNVWIGINAIILKDTTIGDNSIVSAGSVVKGKFPANSIIQGNPATVVKTIEFRL
jgi:acetyltransferase-like isoleucine patch superfamily enzyme